MPHILLATLFLLSLTPQAVPTQAPPPPGTVEWVGHALADIESIKPGMARSDLDRFFQPDGGISTNAHGTYVYKTCPYFKIDVDFTLGFPGKQQPADKIVKISRPYLDYFHAD